MPSRPPRLRLATARWLVVATLLLGALPIAAPAPRPATAQAADCPAEIEPNDTEAEAQPVAGELCLAGDLPTVADQDLLLWTVSGADSPYPWTVTVDGPAGVVTSAKILAVASEPGVEPVVAGAQLADVSTSPTATEPTTATLLFPPGRYLIGLSRTVTEGGGDPSVTTYRLTLDRADDLPAQLDAEPNDDAATASPLPAAFSTAGDVSDGPDVYAWTLSDEEAAGGWELHLLAAVGRSTTLVLTTDLAGQSLAAAAADPLGRVDLYDLALPAGSYLLMVDPAADAGAPYLLSSAVGARPADDLEPNDSPASAAAIDPANPVRKGRIAGTDDVDLYRLAVDPALAGSLFNLRLVARGAQPRELCVASAETGEDLQCKEGVGGAALANILLPRGDYLVRVSGPADPADPYLLRLDVTSAPSDSFESEPNDTEALAAPLDPAVPVHGRFDGDETDVYRFTTAGDPQLWDVAVTGAGITGIAFSRRDGTSLADGAVAEDAASARLTDLYLTPGDHWVRVAGRDGDYDIAMTPLGPPPPDGEHEANNLVVLAEPMLLGQTKTGRLSDTTDRDVFRFSLAADDRVLLTLTPPDDGTVAVAVDWGYTRVGAGTSASPGEPIALDMTLHAGDYLVNLTAFKASDARYALALARGDRFRTRTDLPATLGDQEPNNDAASAQPLPPGVVIDGEVAEGDLRDVYAVLPGAGRDLTFVVVAPDGAYPSLNDGGANYYALSQPGDDPTVWVVDDTVPDDVPLFLEITGAGPYTLTYGPPTPDAPDATVQTDDGADAPDESPGLDLPGIFDGDDTPPSDVPTDEPLPDQPADEPPGASPVAATPVAAEQPTAPLALALTLETTEVAAYWSQGQSLSGALTISNPTVRDLELDLETATSHGLVAVALDDPPTAVAAGASIEVPLTVTVQPDAWADIPVRITVAAYVGDDPAAAFVDLTPTADALPVHPFQAWPLPDALLGGFDLASPALGAVVAGTVDATQEALLHDGVAPIGSGLLVTAPTMPLALTVDLAGDDPAPVTGITVNPQATDGVPQHQVRTFDLLLSTDGVTYTSALTGELPPLAGERAFVLPKPVEATSAQLLILTTYDDAPAAPSAVSLGEWTVVATPGFVPPAAAELDIGSAALGGHVVRWSPQPGDPSAGAAMLSPDEPGSPVLGLSQVDEPGVSWVVGFQDDRAARITELRWVDSLDSVETNRLTEVRVEVSEGTPSGPWTSLGDWDLGRSGDGAVEPLLLDEPTWARFVRLSGTLGEDALATEFPAQLSVVEAPVDDDYRSVVGAWGATSPAASYEVAFPPADAPGPELVDAPETPADAAELALGDTVAGYAQLGTDVDWYRVTAGDDDNTLTLTLTGSPTVDVVVRVYDEAGTPVDAVRRVVGDASTVTYTAPADPGASYAVAVQQPPHSIVFTFDTSASLANYQPLVQQSLRSFASGVRKGHEFVQLVPFDEEPLTEDWTDDTYVVVSAINGYYDKNLSSSVETGVLDSTNLLAGREGATAILVVTDAETGSYDRGDDMWAALDVTRPRIFSVHVGGPATPVLNEQLMQDLSSAGGSYQYTTNQAEMDRAFDRAATWLRRPTPYGLTAAASFEEATPTPEPTAAPTATPTPTPTAPPTEEPTPTPTPTQEPDEPLEPGSIAVRADPGDDAAAVSDAVTVEIILDTSGSMLAPLPDGQLRIDIAQDVLADLVADRLPPGVPVALRVFGDTPDSCDTTLLVPPSPLDPDAMAATIAGIEPVNLVKTPLGASLEAVAEDLADVDGPKVVVLVTDGEETCGGDPADAIRSLADQGVDVQVNIVGFALDDDALRAQFSEWAELGNGAYFDATSADELDAAVAQAVQAPFQVLDADGAIVATGTVGGDPVDVPAGTYDVLVLTDPERRFEDVAVNPDDTVELDLADAD